MDLFMLFGYIKVGATWEAYPTVVGFSTSLDYSLLCVCDWKLNSWEQTGKTTLSMDKILCLGCFV